MKDILKVENLKYKNILNDVSFSLRHKTFNVLISPNGGGKTTLAKALCGLIEYSGSITICDELLNFNNINELRKNIGLLSNFSLLIEHGVMQNLLYPLLSLGYSEDKAKNSIYDLTKKLDIDYLLTKDIDHLSSSEKKLLLFSIAVIHKPKIIIIDDSLDLLDSYYRNKVLKYLKNLKSSTILLMSNNEEDLLLADNIMFLNNGKIKNIINQDEIMQNEKLFLKSNSNLPFMLDLSGKLISYELLNNTILDKKEMIDELWK